jgi:hypothetical protein
VIRIEREKKKQAKSNKNWLICSQQCHQLAMELSSPLYCIDIYLLVPRVENREREFNYSSSKELKNDIIGGTRGERTNS